jgi:hypothetical protein
MWVDKMTEGRTQGMFLSHGNGMSTLIYISSALQKQCSYRPNLQQSRAGLDRLPRITESEYKNTDAGTVSQPTNEIPGKSSWLPRPQTPTYLNEV